MKHPILFALVAALSLPALHAVEVAQTGDQVSIANAAFSLSYNLLLTGKLGEQRHSLVANGHQPVAPENAGMAITREGNLVKLTLTSDTTADVAWSVVWKK